MMEFVFNSILKQTLYVPVWFCCSDPQLYFTVKERIYFPEAKLFSVGIFSFRFWRIFRRFLNILHNVFFHFVMFDKWKNSQIDFHSYNNKPLKRIIHGLIMVFNYLQGNILFIKLKIHSF